MKYPRISPRLAISIGFAVAAATLGCSGSPSDPGLFATGGAASSGLPGVGGQASGGTTSLQQGGNGNGGAAQQGNGGAAQQGNGGAAQQGNGGAAQGNGGAAQGNGGAQPQGGNGNGGAAIGGAPSNGGALTGGNTNRGGATNTGGVNNVGGSATGGKAAGGVATGGSSAGGAATGGAPSTGGAPTTGGNVFSQCRFHFGTIDSKARTNPTLLAQIDMFTSGWIGSSEAFNLASVCTQTNAGQPFAGKVPALVSYIIGFTARRDAGLQDCNVGATATLCNGGATYLRAHFTDRIVPQYVKYAQGLAAGCGSRPVIWMMEPDYYQYTGTADPNRLTPAEAGQMMHTLVTTVTQYQPSAIFSMDISPWIANNGAAWIPNFTMSDFTFISTSGGGTDAGNVRIRANNTMTWAGIRQATGKPILADTGYGAAGASAGHDAAWDIVANINARIADGVISITQYNPVTTWGTTISDIRPQLNPVPCY